MPSKHPPVPAARQETIRREIASLLRTGSFSARELSAVVGIREKDVALHLEHLRRSLGRDSRELVVIPAECLHCGFVFKKRERFQTPGKCPVCRSEAIAEPRFTLT
jgi:predicted Zn-ribbon and HTH transcriptional regulator